MGIYLKYLWKYISKKRNTKNYKNKKIKARNTTKQFIELNQ